MIFFEFPKKILGQDINQDYTIFSRDTNLYTNTICFSEILLSFHRHTIPFSRKKQQSN